jgi:hypothetical protein
MMIVNEKKMKQRVFVGIEVGSDDAVFSAISGGES